MPHSLTPNSPPMPAEVAADVPAGQLATAKAALRLAVLQRRDCLNAAACVEAARAIVARAGDLPVPPAVVIGGYRAIRSEIDPAGLIAALRAAGHGIALPVILADRETMIFRQWDASVELVRASFGLKVPPDGAAIVEPRHLLVPLAGFDRRGYRLGYGKGHYDRVLARLGATGPLVTIGIAFGCQEVDKVPEEAHDRPLDYILTERELIVAKGTS